MPSTSEESKGLRGRLPHDFPRRFLPEGLIPRTWADLEPFFADLEARPLDSPAEMERWIRDQSELASVMSQERTLRYIANAARTDDEEAEAAYLDWVEHLDPEAEPRWNALEVRHLEAPARAALDARYRVYDRSVENQATLFHPDNVPLQVEESRLEQRYSRICGTQSVEFQGRELTLEEMGRFLEEPDRTLREAAWRATAERRLQDAAELEALFETFLDVRSRTAANLGIGYREYAFRSLERFDYGPEHCLRFHETVERAVMPALRRRMEARRRRLGLSALRPWDLQVDPRGGAPLHPFGSPDRLLGGVSDMFERTDPVLSGWFRRMSDLGLLDLEARPGKAPGDFQTSLEEARLPYVFMNVVGRDSDLRGLLHEGGHAFHTFATRAEDVADYRHAPVEFSEVASMAMELLVGPALELAYPPADAARSQLDLLEGIVDLLPHVAMIDAFQHWLYTNPGHSAEQRHAAWVAGMERFTGPVDWAGLEGYRATRWHLITHLYEVPFYFLEYGLAQLGALDLWLQSRSDPRTVLARYRAALALGGSRPLPELFAAAGSSFDLSESRVSRLLGAVLEAIDDLEADL